MKPLVKSIEYHDPARVFAAFSRDSGAVFLDSAMRDKKLGRYSFVAFDPFLIFSSKNDELLLGGGSVQGNPFDVLQQCMQDYILESHAGLPPFQGGVAGFFSYDLCRHLENIPLHAEDDQAYPDLALGFYDIVVAYDHVLRETYLFSSGFPEKNCAKREARALQRLAFLERRLQLALNNFPEALPEELLFESDCIRSNFSRNLYEASVRRIKNYIAAGDVFEVNLSQRFHASLPDVLQPYQLYAALREHNPAPFAAYLNLADTVIASASPERFLQLYDNDVETRPIKGTCRREEDPLKDRRAAENLKNSEKDRAENIMIVDLMRNDLSRVCEPHSVVVDQLCGLETYETVHHLVSVIRGRLSKNLGAIDILKAAFPGGSITGAPKIRAMEIIAELEPCQRGPYCGSVAYLGFDGCMDSSIIIRSFVIKNQQVTFQAGGAIVIDSIPEAEYQETLDKSAALKEVLKLKTLILG